MPRRKQPPVLPDPNQLPPGTPYIRYLRDSGGTAQEKSIPEQQSEIIREAEGQRGWVCAGTFADAAKSGTDPGREGLNDLLAYLGQREHAPVVAIWAYSRLARETGIGYDILAHTRRAGVAIASISDPVSHAHRDIMEPLALWQAAQQSDKISQDTKRGMGAMIAKGYAPGGFPPLGYKAEYDVVSLRRDGTERRWPRWVRDPETAGLVTALWQRRLEGASYQVLQQAVGVQLARNSLTTLLRNPVYAGFPDWWLKYYHLALAECTAKPFVVEPYITIPEWLRAQRLEPGNPRSEFGGWPLTGLLYCGYCGAACIALAYSRSRHCDACGADWPRATATCPACGADYTHRAGWHRYLCGNHHRHATLCRESRYVGGRSVERAILAAVTPLFTVERLAERATLINQALEATTEGTRVQRERVAGELAQAQTAVGNLLDAIGAGVNSAALYARLQAEERRVAALQAELAALPPAGPAPFIGPAALHAVAGIVQRDAPNLRRWELRQLFQSLGLSVELYTDRVAGTIAWPPLNLVHTMDAGGQHRVYPQPDSNRRSPP